MADNSRRDAQVEKLRRYADLIARESGKAVRPYRADGFVNLMTKYGTSKDLSEQYKYVPELQVPDSLLTLFYEGNGLFAKIIDAPAEEAVKHGFTLEDVSDQTLIDFYQEALEELDFEETAMTAIKWARLYGGSIAVMLINDGRGLEEPLDWSNIRSIDDIRVYDRSVIQPDYDSMFSYDPRDPFRTRGSRLGMPERYQVFSKYGTFTVHDSRCLVFRNGVLPEGASNSVYQFWGQPEYVRINKAIRDAEVAHGSAPKLLDRSVQAIYKMRDLSAELATEEGEDRLLKRLQIIDMARGMMNSIAIDSDGEEYDFKTFQFSGVNDVIGASCNMLSAVSNIPQVILFGQKVGGLGNGDDTSMENWYNYIERIEKRMLKSNIRYLLSIVFQAGLATGEVDEVPKIKVSFNPLWSMSDTEKADLELKREQVKLAKAQTTQVYVGMQALDPTEVRKKLADSDEYDVEQILDEYEEEDLFPPDETPSPNGSLLPPGASIPEQGSFAGYAEGVDLEAHNADPQEEGNGPDAAPAATKLPQDMSQEELETAERSGEKLDGGGLEDFYASLKRRLNTDADNDINESVGVIVVKDGKILCGLRDNTKHPGQVCGPGGHLKAGESYEQAAFRETEEEFGISPKELIPLGFGPREDDTGMTPAVFLCTDYNGEPYSRDGEMMAPVFRSMEELMEMSEGLYLPFAASLKLLENCLGEEISEDGGPGSGNFGHKGVPGEVGGSLPNGGDAGLSSMNRLEAAAAVSKYGVGSTVKITKKSGKQFTFTKIGEDKWKRDDQPEFEYEDVGVGSNCWGSEVEVKAQAPEPPPESEGAKETEERSEKQGETEVSKESKPTGPKGTTAATSVADMVGEENLEEFDTGERPNKYPPSDSRWGTEPGEYTVYRSGDVERDVVFTASDFEGSAVYAKGFPDAEGEDIRPINSGVYSYTVQIKKPFVAADLADTYQKLFGTKPKLEPTPAQIKKGITAGDLWVQADEKIAARLRKQGYDAWLMTSPAPPARKELNLIGASRSTMQVTSRKVPDKVKQAWAESVESGDFSSYSFKDGQSQGVTMEDWFGSEAYKQGKDEGRWR